MNFRLPSLEIHDVLIPVDTMSTFLRSLSWWPIPTLCPLRRSHDGDEDDRLSHRRGGRVESFLSYCGGLPAPEAANNPLGYKFRFVHLMIVLSTCISPGYTL